MKTILVSNASARKLPAWIWAAGALLLAVTVIYAPVLRGDWLWDDNSEITANLDLRGPGALWKIWLAPTSPDYFPLKTTVQWLQWQLWQAHATTGYHATSIALHLVAAFLLWRVLLKLGVRLAWLGGLFFAVHPLAVESVAWIAELKNVLSLPPLFLAAAAYLDYDRNQKSSDYVQALIWFVVALLCKSSVVMLPGVLVLYGWWKYGRIRREALRSTLPFFALSAAFGAITLWFQHHRAIGGSELPGGGIAARLMDAGRALGFYFSKSLWPQRLSPIYPGWDDLTFPATPLLALLVFIGITAIAWQRRSAGGRAVLFGLGFFFLNLLPVLGLINMSYQKIAPVADHFGYISLAGIAALAAAGVGAIQQRLPGGNRFLVLAAALVVAGLLARESRSYARVFENQETLWTTTLQRNPRSWTAHNNLGALRLRQEKWAEGAAELEQAIQLNPRYATASLNLGNALAKLGRTSEAEARYVEALRLEPDATEAHYNLANLLVQNGHVPEAIAHYREAIRLGPASVDVQYNLGNALAQSGQFSEAIAHYDEALRLQPDAFGPQLNLGNLLAEAGRFPEAAAHFSAAVRIAPDSADAHYALADVLAQINRLPEAITHYTAALRLAPNDPAVQTSLGNALLHAGRAPEAISHYEAALRLQPDNAEARASLNFARRQP